MRETLERSRAEDEQKNKEQHTHAEETVNMVNGFRRSRKGYSGRSRVAYEDNENEVKGQGIIAAHINKANYLID